MPCRGVPFDSAYHLHPIGVSFDRLGRSCSNGAFEKARPLIEQAWFGSRREPRLTYRPIFHPLLQSADHRPGVNLIVGHSSSF